MAERKREPLIYWITLAGLVYNMFLVEGTIYTFGLLYLELLDKYGEGPQKTGMIATVSGVMGIIVGPFQGRLVDHFGVWKMLILAAFMAATGVIITAFAPNIYVVLASYGLVAGIGLGLAYNVTASAAAKLFIYNRTTATGIMSAGGSLGGLLYPFLFQYLIQQYALQGFMFILAGMCLNFLVSASLLRYIDKHAVIKEISEDLQEATNNETTNNVETQNSKWKSFLAFWKPFLSFRFLMLCFFLMTYYYGFFGYVMYMPPFALEQGVQKNQLTILLSILGATNLLSRILIGSLVNFTNINMYILITINTAIMGCLDVLLNLMLTSGATFSVMIINVVLNGFLAGGLLSLEGQLIVDAVGTEKCATGIGFTDTCYGLSAAIPPLIYGGIKESTGSYRIVPYLSGASLLLSTVFINISRLPRLIRRNKQRSENQIELEVIQQNLTETDI